MLIPSDTATVLNSIGVPPASLIPALTAAATSRRWMLHGITSIQVFATPTKGRDRSSSLNPTALSMARAGALSGPSVRAEERCLGSMVILRLRALSSRKVYFTWWC